MRTKGEESRANILATAKMLFIQHGYANTSIRAIAEESGGQTVANIYNYFNSKEAIFATLIEENNSLSELAARLGNLYGPNTPLLVARVLRILLDYIQTHRDFVELLIIDIREFGRKYLTVIQEDIRPLITTLIHQLETMPDADVFNSTVIMRVLASLAMGYIFTDKLNPDEQFGQIMDAAWIDQFVDACTGGIAYLASKKVQIVT